MRPYLFLIFLLGLGGWYFYCLFHDTGQEGLVSKAEWADLQGTEYNLRSKPVKEATIVEKEFLEIPGSQSSSSGLVILLNAKAEPYYKQMPEGFYRLSQADLTKVQSSGLASSTVLAVLSSHVDPNKSAFAPQ